MLRTKRSLGNGLKRNLKKILKERPKLSKIPQFGCEMHVNCKNIASKVGRFCIILYYAWEINTQGYQSFTFTPFNENVYKIYQLHKQPNFTKIAILPNLRSFSSCGDIFAYFELFQNFV